MAVTMSLSLSLTRIVTASAPLSAQVIILFGRMRHMSLRICDRSSHISLENVTLFDHLMARVRKKWMVIAVSYHLHLLMLSLGGKVADNCGWVR